MPGGQERILRRRIRSVEATKKITRAFELIAASQIVRATGRIAGARPYVAGMRHVVSVTAAELSEDSRYLGEPERTENVLMVVLVADRGLCGGYNSIALRTADRAMREGEASGRQYRVVTVGRKAQSYFRFRGRPVETSFIQMTDRPTYADARAVAAAVTAPFMSGEVDLVEIVSWRFRSAGSQVIERRRLLPLTDEATTDTEPADDEHRSQGFYDFEPEPPELIELLVSRYAEVMIFEALLEASASEHTARQRAMAAATENAEEFITNLRREMNRVRQEAITTEIMEIVGGAEALRGSGEPSYSHIDQEQREEYIA